MRSGVQQRKRITPARACRRAAPPLQPRAHARVHAAHLVARARAGRRRLVVVRARLLHACVGACVGSEKRQPRNSLEGFSLLFSGASLTRSGRGRARAYARACARECDAPFFSFRGREKESAVCRACSKRKTKQKTNQANSKHARKWLTGRARSRPTAARTPRARPSSPCVPWRTARPCRPWRWNRPRPRRRPRRPAPPRPARPARVARLTARRRRGRARPAMAAAGRPAARR